MSLLRSLTRKDAAISKLFVLIAICTLFFCSCGEDATQNRTEKVEKVVVVGAGVSGLIAALHLEENGIEVTILEKEPQVGGRVYSVPFGGTNVNLGAQYFFETGKHLDFSNITLCSGSRDSDGNVPDVYWDDGKLCVDWDDPQDASSDLRARAVVP